MDKIKEKNNININSDTKTDCPCKRTSCERHGSCHACRAHHRSMKKLVLTACERLEEKRQKQKRPPIQ